MRDGNAGARRRRLRLRPALVASCRFRYIVAHSGGLPGFGSQMRWLPDYGVGIIAFGNRTYTGWGPPIDQALEVMAKTGALEPKPREPSADLMKMRETVTRLVMAWDDDLAKSIAADNLFLDRSIDRRAREVGALHEKVGACRRHQGLATSRMRCAGSGSSHASMAGSWRRLRWLRQLRHCAVHGIQSGAGIGSHCAAFDLFGAMRAFSLNDVVPGKSRRAHSDRRAAVVSSWLQKTPKMQAERCRRPRGAPPSPSPAGARPIAAP